MRPHRMSGINESFKFSASPSLPSPSSPPAPHAAACALRNEPATRRRCSATSPSPLRAPLHTTKAKSSSLAPPRGPAQPAPLRAPPQPPLRLPTHSAGRPSARPITAAPPHTSEAGRGSLQYASNETLRKPQQTVARPSPHRSTPRTIAPHPLPPVQAHAAPAVAPHPAPSKSPATTAQPFTAPCPSETPGPRRQRPDVVRPRHHSSLALRPRSPYLPAFESPPESPDASPPNPP